MVAPSDGFSSGGGAPATEGGDLLLELSMERKTTKQMRCQRGRRDAAGKVRLRSPNGRPGAMRLPNVPPHGPPARLAGRGVFGMQGAARRLARVRARPGEDARGRGGT